MLLGVLWDYSVFHPWGQFNSSGASQSHPCSCWCQPEVYQAGLGVRWQLHLSCQGALRGPGGSGLHLLRWGGRYALPLQYGTHWGTFYLVHHISILVSWGIRGISISSFISVVVLLVCGDPYWYSCGFYVWFCQGTQGMFFISFFPSNNLLFLFPYCCDSC